MNRKVLIALTAPLLLAACDRIDALLHPYDEAAPTHVIPAPPDPKGPVVAYPDGDTGISLQSRPGDCAKTACLVLKRGKWLPLPADATTSVSLLNVESATGSHYQDDLWRPVGTSGRHVLVNDRAGENNVAAGLFDGPRIGLKDGRHTTYVTVYAVEDTPAPACASGDTDGAAICPQPLPGGLSLMAPSMTVIARGDKVWLLQTRPNDAANMIDLFAVSAGPQIICMPGLILDTAGRWAGPPEQALSPDIFVSRTIDRNANAARRDALLRICHPPAPPKPPKA